MHRALAIVLPFSVADRLDPVELARRMIVIGCAAALIFAGRAFPF